MDSIEQRVEALEAELAEVERQLRGERRGVIGRMQPNFLDTTFGIHTNSAAFPDVMREIEAEREKERLRINRAQTHAAAHADLQDNLVFFSRIAVWEYDERADENYVQLVNAKVRVGTKDLRIASIALVNSATVLTRNTRDFARISDLMLANWVH